MPFSHLTLFVFCCFVVLSVAESVGEWKFVKDSPRDEIIPISIALKNRNTDWLLHKFEQVSNPKHPNWRKFVTKEKLREMTAPSEMQVRRVTNFLSDYGMINYELYPSGDFLMTNWRVADVEKLFAVSLGAYRNHRTNQVIHRSMSHYTLPSDIADLVDVVGMISEFPEGHFSARTSKSIVPPKQPDNFASFDNTTCGSVMNWGYPASSDTDLYSQVQIVCCNGQFTTNLTSPCYESQNTLIGFQTSVYSNKTAALVNSNFVSYESVLDSCFLDGTSVTCPINFTPKDQVQPDQDYNIYVVGVFQDSSEGTPSQFPVKLVTSPFVTPQLFAEYYEIPNYFTSNYKATGNSQSVVEFGGQYYSPDDLSRFFGNMSLPNTLASVVGTNDASTPGDEATLDIEWIMAVGTEIDTVFWSVDVGYLLEWAQQLLSATNTPLVNSVSYGGNESNSPVDYRNRVDQEFQKLATLGVSIVVSSGDAGATNIGHGSESCDLLEPQYPAASPFVTSVSAVYFTPTDVPMCSISYYGKQVHCSDVHMGEVAVSADDGMDWTTGGGFSSSVPRPSWQDTAVSGYLNTYSSLLPPSNMFNSTNRAYPDVSATGHNLMLILKDAMDIGDGTSASSPIFTGILALLNQYLLSVGEAPLGFVNPLLYQIAQETPAAFYDVTMGNNLCGDVLHPPYVACCPQGYKSSIGWDPVTGLGSPRFATLFSAVADAVAQQKKLNE